MLHVTRSGAVVTCALNRPKALNALNLDMIRELTRVLRACAADAACRVLVLKGEGGRAFCAGGDMKAIARDSADDSSKGALARAFFAEEYALNASIAEFPKPQVSVWDGIVMGGGAGLSVHGRFRVATERTLFAMPETAIGFVPDVGASHFLPRLPGRSGLHVGLVGARMGPGDVLALGLATHFVPAAVAGRIPEALAECTSVEEVDARLRALGCGARPAPPEDTEASVAAHAADIDRCYAAPTMAGVLEAVRAEGTTWGAATAAALVRLSPASLALTLRLLRAGAGAPLRDCLAREYETAMRIVTARPNDLCEGVRAVLVDKDNTPMWAPPELTPLAEAEVLARFDAMTLPEDVQAIAARLRVGTFDELVDGGPDPADSGGSAAYGGALGPTPPGARQLSTAARARKANCRAGDALPPTSRSAL